MRVYSPIIAIMATKRTLPHPFGRVFLQALKDTGFTRYKLRKLTGRSDAQIYGIAKGSNAPTIDTIIWIAETIGMEPQELFRRLYEAMQDDRQQRQSTAEAE